MDGSNEMIGMLRSVQRVPFAVRPYYEKRSDSLICHFSNEQSYELMVTRGVSLFLSTTDDRIIGVEISGIRQLMLNRREDVACSLAQLTDEQKFQLACELRARLVIGPWQCVRSYWTRMLPCGSVGVRVSESDTEGVWRVSRTSWVKIATGGDFPTAEAAKSYVDAQLRAVPGAVVVGG